jgi:hypothetical protein
MPIDTPASARARIRLLKKEYANTHTDAGKLRVERALDAAAKRAEGSAERKNISAKDRKEFLEVADIYNQYLREVRAERSLKRFGKSKLSSKKKITPRAKMSEFAGRPKFAGRPSKAKSFSGKERPEVWEVLESEFLDEQARRQKKIFENSISWREQELEKLGPRAIRKREEAESAIAWQKKILGQLNEGDTRFYDSTWRREYEATIKKAISKGMPVPQAVIEQRPEFKLAETARERYEKGRHTSFANVSIAINESMKRERGFKVKRQDGKAISDQQISEVTTGVNEVESVVGSLKGLFEKTNITIAHTSGKHPFLSMAGGQYSVNDRTISTGVTNKFTKQPIPSLAHEFGHWLDSEAGIAIGAETSEYTRNRKRRMTKSLAAYDSFIGSNPLISEARKTMRDRMEVQRLMKMKLKNLSDLEKKGKVQEVKVVLGPYWHEKSEIWARLVEQYVADELRNKDYPKVPRGRRDGYISARTDYTLRAAYWDQKDFDKMKPEIKRQIDRRIKIIETGRDDSRPLTTRRIRSRAEV